ncbi:alpha/beta hydrolase family protein [Actinokineospora enzanensis]|uniref:alpha/beta hydrolase family protein n=1 Tax=Actinokineospora enzanensis TaxID=155975 RepID=UPI000380DC3A|nr:lipase family protein [Actinokineospora enzanensis]
MIKSILVVILSIGLVTTATVPAPAGPARRGELLSAVPITSRTPAQVTELLAGQSIDTRWVRYGVDAYRLEYRTVDPTGRPITASGAVALPRGGGHRLPTIDFQHGTIAAKAEAGSVSADTNRLAPITFAAAGYATVAPDYLGLGTGDGAHPYLDLPTETSASVDLLRAADTFVRRAGRTLDRRVLLTGFSQGGPAAMALGRALREGVDRRFSVRAIAGVSGVYDLYGTQFPAALDGTIVPKLATISIAYYLVAMNRLYRLPAQAFRAPYDTVVPDLFDGTHSGADIAAKLPDTPADLLTDWAVQQLRHPTGPMLRAAQASDGSCAGWTPRASVRLFTATDGDELVPIGNSVRCQEAFRSRGVDAPITDLGRVDHNTSAKRSYPLILDFFADLP